MGTLIIVCGILVGAVFTFFALVLVVGTISDHFGARRAGRSITKHLDP